jgi:hypothetical protein
MSLLDDDTIDTFASLFSRKPDIGYVSSVNTQAVCNKIEKYGFEYYNTKDVRKEIGITGKEEGIQIVIHYQSHWSLVWYWRKTNRLYHYDSLLHHNFERAKYVIELFQYLGAIPQTEKWVHPNHYPLQYSGWSCGYFVCASIFALNDKAEIAPLSYKDIWNRYCTLFMNEEVMKDTIDALLLQKGRKPKGRNSSNPTVNKIFGHGMCVQLDVDTSSSDIVR